MLPIQLNEDRLPKIEVDDANDVQNAMLAVKKCETFDMILACIANWYTHISRTFLVKQTTSLSDLLQQIREHYGFQSTDGHFLDISVIRQKPD